MTSMVKTDMKTRKTMEPGGGGSASVELKNAATLDKSQ